MKRYYIECASGNFDASIEYAEKTKEEMLDDIRYYIEEGQQSPFETIEKFETFEEAKKSFSKYYNDVWTLKNGKRCVVNYSIYNLECEETEDDN